MANYRLTPDAKTDLWRIYQWGFLNYGEEAADEYYNVFFDHFEMLTERPFIGSEALNLGNNYRKIVCGVDTIYYRISVDTIEIISILGRQDTKKLL